MENTELRIGNLVYHNGKIVKVVGIDKKHVNILKDPLQCYFHTVPINGLEPIPLTEEILLKCGFSNESIIHNPGIDLALKIDEDYYIVFDKRYIKESIIITNGKSYDEDSTIYLHKKITQLHQLQNLYHSLTNKELKYETN